MIQNVIEIAGAYFPLVIVRGKRQFHDLWNEKLFTEDEDCLNDSVSIISTNCYAGDGKFYVPE